VPIFPVLLPHLREAFEEAEPGAEFAITRYRETGLNLRSTRETELCETWPEHVVCAWLGHPQSVARKHYLQVTEKHFAEAAQQPSGDPCKPVQTISDEPAQIAVFQGMAAECKCLQNKEMGGRRLELLTSCVSSRRSSQLS
jgi:hypothetical protein